MTREELDFIGSMNMCDEISNEAYKKIVCHCEEQEPCPDAINRQVVLEVLKDKWNAFSDANDAMQESIDTIEALPPVKPQYTKVEIHKIQDLEQAEIEKAYELGKAEGQECPDAISRQAVLDLLVKYDNDMEFDVYSEIFYNIDKLPPVNPQQKTGHCKDCKWWKDSDGLYRRGSHAESQCPINRREVFEGNGYCYMFEPQECEG